MSKKPKVSKLFIIIAGVLVVLIVGYFAKQYFFKAKKEAITRQIKEQVKGGKKQKKKDKEELAKELISKQMGVPQETVPVRVYKVSKVDYHDDLPVVGTIKSVPEIELKFRKNGMIERFQYKEGNKLKKGDVIAVLDQKETKLEIEYARAKVKAAEAEANTVRKRLEVVRELYKTGALIKAKVEEIEAQLEAAERKVDQTRAELASTKVRLEKTYLYAPRDGVLANKEVEEGEFVTPNDKVASLFDSDSLYAEVGIIEKDIGKIKRGQRAKIIVDTYMKQSIEFWGSIEQIFPNIEPKSRTLNVRIKITSRRAQDLLLPGMFARVKIYIYAKNNAIVVPDTAVNLRTRPPKVSFIKDGKVVNKPITYEWVGTNYIVVKEGVNVGDIIIVETPGLKTLKTGTPVEIIETQTNIYE